MIEVVQVGTADATGFDGYLDLSLPCRFRLAFLDPEIAGGVYDDSFHGFLLSKQAICASMVTGRP
jgi:hypothetical protein